MLGRLTPRFLRLPTADTGEAPPRDAEAVAESVRRRVRTIEIQARALLRERLMGEYRSAFRGRGLEFHQIRAYLPGDDVRFIDWNVTARRSQPYIKQFVEERERTLQLLVDVSPSQAFGTAGRSVRDFAIEIGSLLGYAAAVSNDRISVVAFSDRVEYTLPARKGARHVLRLLRDLLTLQPVGRGTDLSVALDTGARLVRRGSIVVVLSDFHTQGWEAALRRTAQQHDVVALVLRDPRAGRIPRGGLLTIEDLESGRTLLVEADVAAPALAAAAAARERELVARFATIGVDHLFLTVGEDYVRPLATLFRARMRRR